MPHISSGKFRALTAISAQSPALVPGFPKVADSGLPDYAMGNRVAMFAPAKLWGPSSVD